MQPTHKRCPVCLGLGRVLAFGFAGAPVPLRCPECAGLDVLPASADDPPAPPEGPAPDPAPGCDETDAA